MKQVLLNVCVFAAISSVVAAQEGKQPANSELKTLKAKASYAIGLNIGRSIQQDGADVDPALIAKGIADVLSGAKPKLSPMQISEIMSAFSRQMKVQADEKRKLDAEKNKKEGEAFLAANKKKSGVTTTASGLQYQVVKAGSGAKPKATDTVKVHYHGTLLDGKVFDSSVNRGEPITFPVGGVIKGWQEAMQLMKVGAKWKLFIPSELAYGASPRPGGPIGPHAVLIFDVELLGVE